MERNENNNYIVDCINITGSNGHRTEHRRAGSQLEALEKKASKVDLLIEDYERRLKTINQEIESMRFKDDANPDHVRMSVKASQYRTFIAELKREES